MPADRHRAQVPPVVTTLVGVVVALVSAVFGIAAHGMAAGAEAGAGAVVGVGAPSLGQVLLVAAGCAGVGAATASVARRRPPMPTAALGLIAGQGLVHLVLASAHTHAASPGSARTALGHHSTDPAVLRAAMDSAATGGAGSEALVSAASLLTPGMLGAHLAAIALTLALVGVLSGALAWVAARVTPLPGAAHLVVVAPLISSYDAGAPRDRFLLARGGTRAPPVAV